MDIINEWRLFEGRQLVFQHFSTATQTPMEFALYLPPRAAHGPVPLVTYLSGLTCNWSNVTEKAGAQRKCAELGLAFLAPDTSPRGAGIEGEDDTYDFGSGAGFYLDAIENPWSANYQMYSYISKELPELIAQFSEVDMMRQSLMGHSMGGHGALTIGLKNAQMYKSISAFAPICAPMRCPWGRKAFSGYLGEDKNLWRAYDACALLQDGYKGPDMLVDQGEADQFLQEQLKPDLLVEEARAAGQNVEMHRREGYDHSYYFMASFMEDHLDWHNGYLKG
ncbi:MAG: S-formylglutathione hydrolase [bacterium]